MTAEAKHADISQVTPARACAVARFTANLALVQAATTVGCAPVEARWELHEAESGPRQRAKMSRCGNPMETSPGELCRVV
jgi:hypothetical protein